MDDDASTARTTLAPATARPDPRTVRRVAALLAAVVLGAAACSSGPSAPPAQPTSEVCTDAFCMEVPDGWGDEIGDTFLAFNHDVLPEGTFLTANLVDMEAIVQAAGGSWPVPPDEVTEAFWSLLEQVDEGELRRIERQVGGAIRSWGRHSTGDMWHLLVPVGATDAIGVEMRGPNDSWESHADAVFPTVAPIPGSTGTAP